MGVVVVHFQVGLHLVALFPFVTPRAAKRQNGLGGFIQISPSFIFRQSQLHVLRDFHRQFTCAEINDGRVAPCSVHVSESCCRVVEDGVYFLSASKLLGIARERQLIELVGVQSAKSGERERLLVRRAVLQLVNRRWVGVLLAIELFELHRGIYMEHVDTLRLLGVVHVVFVKFGFVVSRLLIDQTQLPVNGHIGRVACFGVDTHLAVIAPSRILFVFSGLNVFKYVDVVERIGKGRHTDMSGLEFYGAVELDKSTQQFGFGFHLAVGPRRIRQSAFQYGAYTSFDDRQLTLEDPEVEHQSHFAKRVSVNLSVGIVAVLAGGTPIATLGRLEFLERQIETGYHLDVGIAYHGVQRQLAGDAGSEHYAAFGFALEALELFHRCFPALNHLGIGTQELLYLRGQWRQLSVVGQFVAQT